jgi:hypothetical protein
MAFFIKEKIVRSIAFVSDLHVGSPYGLWPNEFVCPTGHIIKASRGQLKILEYWNDFLIQCKRYKVDTIVSLGDVVDGTNRKEYGRDRMVTDLNLQILAARQLLEPVTKGRKFFGVSGTGYHDSLDFRAEESLIKDLDGTYWGLLRNIKLKGTKVVLNVSHGRGGGTLYRSTKGDKELLFILAAEAAKKIDFHVDCFVRGHLHFYGYIDQAVNSYLACPGWTDWIPYPPSLGLIGKQPDIGFVIMLINNKNEISIKRKLFPLPNIAQGVRTA